MAVSTTSACFVCLAALMVVMATVMLSCDADPKEWCSGLEDGCTEDKCKGWCEGRGYTKGIHCQDVATCCCRRTATKPMVDVVRGHD
ncbi:hypothetical protein ZWY2020_012050 [Hordeum vulgare]|nr:hypothetical protein ZWY2020_012050 [Hordeum vulgare]